MQSPIVNVEFLVQKWCIFVEGQYERLSIDVMGDGEDNYWSAKLDRKSIIGYKIYPDAKTSSYICQLDNTVIFHFEKQETAKQFAASLCNPK